jgi:hypothetical protein
MKPVNAHRYAPPPCPSDPAHGPLLDWPGSHTAWYCPHVRCGRFFTTDLVPAHRPGADNNVDGTSAGSTTGAVRRPGDAQERHEQLLWGI